MAQEKKRNWVLVALGVLLVLLGCIVAAYPGLTLVAIALFAGAAFLMAGIGGVYTYVKLRKTPAVSGWTLAYAVIDILVGAFMLVHPLANAAVIPWLVGICIAILGVFEIFAALKGRGKDSVAWGWGVLSGALNIICGVLFFMMPALLAFLFAFVTMLRGVTMVIFGIAGTKAA